MSPLLDLPLDEWHYIFNLLRPEAQAKCRQLCRVLPVPDRQGAEFCLKYIGIPTTARCIARVGRILVLDRAEEAVYWKWAGIGQMHVKEGYIPLLTAAQWACEHAGGEAKLLIRLRQKRAATMQASAASSRRPVAGGQ